MDETLGKRIVSNRKRLGITQDRLAEQLGVTAQAVSKWENDQSCPDITMLPKLSEIFGISTDVLLGITEAEPMKESEAEAVQPEQASVSGHNWEFHWDGGRKTYLGLSVWIILTAGWLFASSYFHWYPTFWELLWTNGLIVFGLFGLLPRFSFFRLGCVLIGTYFLLDSTPLFPSYFGQHLLLPAFLLLFGLSLLADALLKPHRPCFSVIHNGKTIANAVSGCNIGDDSFDVECSFGERNHVIALPCLRRGDASVSFGHMTLDLTGVEHFAPGCRIDADCSFGELTILIPRQIRVEVDSSSAFGSVAVQGNHQSEVSGSVSVVADASFGQITVMYL